MTGSFAAVGAATARLVPVTAGGAGRDDRGTGDAGVLPHPGRARGCGARPRAGRWAGGRAAGGGGGARAGGRGAGGPGPRPRPVHHGGRHDVHDRRRARPRREGPDRDPRRGVARAPDPAAQPARPVLAEARGPARRRRHRGGSACAARDAERADLSAVGVVVPGPDGPPHAGPAPDRDAGRQREAPRHLRGRHRAGAPGRAGQRGGPHAGAGDRTVARGRGARDPRRVARAPGADARDGECGAGFRGRAPGRSRRRGGAAAPGGDRPRPPGHRGGALRLADPGGRPGARGGRGRRDLPLRTPGWRRACPGPARGRPGGQRRAPRRRAACGARRRRVRPRASAAGRRRAAAQQLRAAPARESGLRRRARALGRGAPAVGALPRRVPLRRSGPPRCRGCGKSPGSWPPDSARPCRRRTRTSAATTSTSWTGRLPRGGPALLAVDRRGRGLLRRAGDSPARGQAPRR